MTSRLTREQVAIPDAPKVSPGTCECGCGQKTNLVKTTRSAAGLVRGQPRRFVAGHSSCRFRRGGRTRRKGYIELYRPGHHRASEGYVLEHILVVEAAMGKRLPAGATIHHVNGNTADNRPQNLVVCPSDAYHKLLHRRAGALAACGHASWLKCKYCRVFSPPDEVYVWPRSGGAAHRPCIAADAARRYAPRRAILGETGDA